MLPSAFCIAIYSGNERGYLIIKKTALFNPFQHLCVYRPSASVHDLSRLRQPFAGLDAMRIHRA